MDVEAFYLPLGDNRFSPTRATESPWDADAQHGGPPSALLAHLAAGATGDGLRAARVSVDFLGAIPRRELTVEVSAVRPGRRIALTEAAMSVDGRTVAVARVWSIATGPTPPVVTELSPPPAVPTANDLFLPHLPDWGYGQALDWRYTAGSPDRPGAADVWTRVRLPLVAGRPLTGLDRTLIAADAANGISAELPISSWFSIPPGMTTHLTREPDGDWVHLSCRSTIAADGIGLCLGTLSDARGEIGQVAQPLLVQQR
ncbi:thioesterase family protein [Modestobacter roseus]|uniref:Thioesterase superfamily protein n=1 Tax=Modestobacter roseus TaxID=1181884 RepID=A0A562ISE2_9ACTN|nr:thioesterase family protein [Modestobacter roseus]MQA35126.1 thioesterase family protein [Modestobacter roseus]TWH73643.1 thioesterase superfamily protein [Modestobacter roseus]